MSHSSTTTERQDIALAPPKRPWLSPTSLRRWQNFKANRRGFWAF